MEILNFVFVLIFNILSVKNVHCEITKEESYHVQMTESVKNVSDLPIIIDPLILLYLSDHMSSQECFQYYNYLVSSQYQNKMVLNRTWSYEDFITRDPLGKRGEFPCFPSLKRWIFHVQSLAKGELDKKIYAETFILAALPKINRGDLRSWLEKVIRAGQHDEIQHFEKELHAAHSKLSNKQSTRKHSFEEEEARSMMIIGFICFLFFAGLSAGILTYACISIRLRPRDYIPLNSSDTKTNQSHKWGSDPYRGYYNFVPVNDV